MYLLIQNASARRQPDIARVDAMPRHASPKSKVTNHARASPYAAYDDEFIFIESLEFEGKPESGKKVRFLLVLSSELI
jgi:hypothetical protein